MSPPKNSNYPARSEDRADTLRRMEQFIWDDAAPPRLPHERPISEHRREAPPRVALYLDDHTASEEAPIGSWHRQLISALHDSDRENALATSPRDLPPILPTEAARRAPRALETGRSARTGAHAPVERQARRRVGSVLLLGISAVALLSALMPETANTPEFVASIESQPSIVIGSLTELPDDATIPKPLMFNTPVLVREVLSPKESAEAGSSPEIRTVRTVAVLLGARPETPEEVIAQASADLPPAAPPVDPVITASASEPATEPEITASSAAPTSHASEDADREPFVSDVATRKAPVRASARGPRIATAYEHAEPEQKRATRQRPARSQQATAAPRRTTERAAWEANRQGLRTPPPPAEEPTTMVKLLQTLFPFGSQNQTEVPAKEPANASKTTTPATKKDSFWWGEQQPTR